MQKVVLLKALYLLAFKEYDGFTGTDFNRPSFQRLLEDMRNGNIKCVVVKDLSRLGRNYIEVRKLYRASLPKNLPLQLSFD